MGRPIRAGLLGGVVVSVCLGSVAAAPAPADPGRPPPGSPGIVKFRRDALWSLRVSSHTLLADRGYAVEYLFEFVDEEEIRVQAIGPADLVAGSLRTILDGEPVEAEVRLPTDPAPLVLRREGDRVVAAWREGTRLRPAGLPGGEVARRLEMLVDLWRLTRRRLGLEEFRPSEDARVRLRLEGVDALVLVPSDPSGSGLRRYEIRRPGGPGAVEMVVAERDGLRWEVTWTGAELEVVVGPALAAVPVTVLYRGGEVVGRAGRRTLDPVAASRIAFEAVALLQAARSEFRTGRLLPPLPDLRVGAGG